MLSKEVLESRAKSFQSVNLDDIKRKRAEGFIELRKQNRSQLTQKRRAIIAQVLAAPRPGERQKPVLDLSPKLVEFRPEIEGMHGNYVAMVKVLCDVLNSREGGDVRKAAIETLKVILSTGEEPFMQEAVQQGAIPELVKEIQVNDDERAFQACWCLTNLTAGSHEIAEKVVKEGFLDISVSLMTHPSLALTDQAIWTLCNLAGDCIEYRDAIIKSPLIPKFLDLIRSNSREFFLARLIWLFSNLSRGLPPPPASVFQSAISVVPLVFAMLGTDEYAILDACAIMENATFTGDAEMVTRVFSLNVHPRLMEMVRADIVPKTKLGCLKVIGNLVLGADEQVDAMLDLGLLDIFYTLLVTSHKAAIQKETLWGLSNIAGGSVAQIIRLTEHRVFGKVVEQARSADMAVRKEVIMTLANMTAKFDVAVARKMLGAGVVEVFLDAFEEKDAHLILYSVEGLWNLLRFCFSCESLEPIARSTFEDLSGISRLERLMGHQSSAIYDKVVKVMDELYGFKDEKAERREDEDRFEFS